MNHYFMLLLKTRYVANSMGIVGTFGLLRGEGVTGTQT